MILYLRHSNFLVINLFLINLYAENKGGIMENLFTHACIYLFSRDHLPRSAIFKNIERIEGGLLRFWIGISKPFQELLFIGWYFYRLRVDHRHIAYIETFQHVACLFVFLRKETGLSALLSRKWTTNKLTGFKKGFFLLPGMEENSICPLWTSGKLTDN